jgi:hypothetical protein
MQMNPYAVGVVVFSGIFLSFTYLSTLLTFALIGKVNRYRAEDDQIPYFGIPFRRTKHLGNLWIFGEYRRLYPRGRLHIYLLLDLVGGLVGFIGAVTCFFLAPTFPGGP